LNTELPNPNAVLVIDDEPAIHRLIEARLRPEGIEVTGEVDGERGIARAIAESPDLILLDIGLPVLDGFEVCRRLKDHATTRNIPIIFLTVLPWMYLVWWKRNVYLSILIHCLGNSLGASAALFEFFS